MPMSSASLTIMSSRGVTTLSERDGLPDLTPDIIATLVKAGAERKSPLSFLVTHHLHGAGIRVAPDATAFGMRRKHFMLEIGAAWEPSSKAEGDVHRQWALPFPESRNWLSLRKAAYLVSLGMSRFSFVRM
jgi:hypothetical protein